MSIKVNASLLSNQKGVLIRRGGVFDLPKLMEQFVGRTKEDGGTIFKTDVSGALNLGRGC